MNKLEAIERISREKVIAIIRGQSRDNVLKTAEALIKGGISCMEITYNAKDRASDEATAQTLQALIEKFGNDVLAGSGTVLYPEQVCLTAEAGGKYIISPDTNIAVIEKTLEKQLISMPGALTPTEAQRAYSAGADFVKLFPIGNMGASYFKAITAPLSHIKFMAVGGVNAENLADFLKAGACGIGAGGDLANATKIAAGDFAAITERAKQYVEAVRAFEMG